MNRANNLSLIWGCLCVGVAGSLRRVVCFPLPGIRVGYLSVSPAGEVAQVSLERVWPRLDSQPPARDIPYAVGGEGSWKAQSMAELTPHPFLFSCCVLQSSAGSQVSAQDGQGSPSAVSDSLPFDPWYRELAWMETLLSPELGGDPVLRVRTRLGDHPLRPSTGSTKAESLVSSTDLGCTPGLCVWLLGSGKRSILLTQMEWKEWLSSWTLLGGFLSHCPLCSLTHTPRGRLCPRRLTGAAGSARPFVCPLRWVRHLRLLGSGG